jgi:hypothetical protein
MMIDRIDTSKLIVEINKKVLMIEVENIKQASDLKTYF